MLLGIWYRSVNRRAVKKWSTAGSAANGLLKGFDGKFQVVVSGGLGFG